MAPVASAGVNSPPMAPLARQAAVAAGLSTIRVAAIPRDTAPSKASPAMPLPLPSNGAYLVASTPSAVNTTGIATTVCQPEGAFDRHRLMRRLNATPSTPATGPSTSAQTTTGGSRPAPVTA